MAVRTTTIAALVLACALGAPKIEAATPSYQPAPQAGSQAGSQPATEQLPAADAQVSRRLEDVIERNTQGQVKVNGVRRTPVPGLYQVESEGEILYVDETGRYGFVGGSLVDMQTRRDLTAAATDRVTAVDFNSLPLQHALKQVRGNGKRKLAVFEDPNCPICRVFTKFVDQLDNVTVYRFMFPVIEPQSVSLARRAWCSADRLGTWRAFMAGAQPPVRADREDCDTRGLATVLELGERLHIRNTPTVVLANGKRLVGATPPEQFMAELDAQ